MPRPKPLRTLVTRSGDPEYIQFDFEQMISDRKLLCPATAKTYRAS